ncbi:MAG: TetR family transcriptional regulator [Actinobacteria bacterium]|nr:TetR family transcriptional regulator [Actinomycetota bacterium]
MRHTFGVERTVAPTNETRRDRKRRDTRDALATAAMELFEEQGFAATTIDDITERADVARRTFFRHFQSKEAVLLIDPEEYSAQLADLFSTLPTPLTFGQLIDHLWEAVRTAVADDPVRRRRAAIILESDLNIGQAAWAAFSAIRTAAVERVSAANGLDPNDPAAVNPGLTIAFAAICNAYIGAIEHANDADRPAGSDEFDPFSETIAAYEALIDRDAVLVE